MRFMHIEQQGENKVRKCLRADVDVAIPLWVQRRKPLGWQRA